MSSSLDVVIPCFGNSTLIEETLDSLVNQTIKDFKTILVIDQLDAQYYLDLANNFRDVLEIEVLPLNGNYGITNATVSGIIHSQSDWVALLDHDDWLVPDAIEVVLEHISMTKDSVIALFTGRIDSETMPDNGHFYKKTYQGDVLGAFYPSTTHAAIVHNFLSHMKIYRKDRFELLNDPRIDGIQDWYWLLSNSNRGEYHFIEKPLYIHRIHALQNTKSEKSLKSVYKMQMQKRFIQENFPFRKFPADYLQNTSLHFLKENISKFKFSTIFLIGGGKSEIYAFNPILLFDLLLNNKSDDSYLLVVPRSQLDLSLLLSVLGSEDDCKPIGLVVSRQLFGSELVLKSQGGLFDFIVPLDPETELISSFAGLPLKHLDNSGSRYHSVVTESLIGNVKRGLKLRAFSWYRNNELLILRILPLGSKRRMSVKRLYSIIFQ